VWFVHFAPGMAIALPPPAMRWPMVPLERVPPSRFTPPHCPWPECSSHSPSSGAPFRFQRHGSFQRLCDRRRVPRFLCLSCKRTFSLQTFAFSYYLKRPTLSLPIASGLNAGSAFRQLARSLLCSPSTVARRSARLGRHSLLLLARSLASLPDLDEPIVYDDFESFVHSQDRPLGVGTAVGKSSWFVYSLDQAPHHRRSSTPWLRERHPSRLTLSIPNDAYFHEATRLLTLLAGKATSTIRLLTDGHSDYLRAIRTHPDGHRFEHQAFPNPERGPQGTPRSPEAKARDAALFPVDLLHRILRHTIAHHRRETIAFARRVEGVLERGFLTAIWRNFVKLRSERRPDGGTPAMRLALTDARWSWQRVLSRRLFPTKTELPQGWDDVYWRALRWPDPTRMKPHELKHAC